MTGLNFQVLRICAEVESEIIGIKLQPVAEMLRHSDGKQAFFTSNRCKSHICEI